MGKVMLTRGQKHELDSGLGLIFPGERVSVGRKWKAGAGSTRGFNTQSR